MEIAKITVTFPRILATIGTVAASVLTWIPATVAAQQVQTIGNVPEVSCRADKEDCKDGSAKAHHVADPVLSAQEQHKEHDGPAGQRCNVDNPELRMLFELLAAAKTENPASTVAGDGNEDLDKAAATIATAPADEATVKLAEHALDSIAGKFCASVGQPSHPTPVAANRERESRHRHRH